MVTASLSSAMSCCLAVSSPSFALTSSTSIWLGLSTLSFAVLTPQISTFPCIVYLLHAFANSISRHRHFIPPVLLLVFHKFLAAGRECAPHFSPFCDSIRNFSHRFRGVFCGGQRRHNTHNYKGKTNHPYGAFPFHTKGKWWPANGFSLATSKVFHIVHRFFHRQSRFVHTEKC